ncbi:hypothetical protein JDV02_005553 [Purpureocillium takamizusanense]|uniref:Uncharacterized protein n=1 Tax=Purpureocillium takamizusanense TaxID=2060973 RepID=A0A9Q8VC13_9HYPO|nr:uncharacterized protein JDV02_005553 [Purpureocillium takamizusanense]UNI19367.1 hypothetical protein JDV02_005553 [Purpureocillium takamizusanense]
MKKASRGEHGGGGGGGGGSGAAGVRQRHHDGVSGGHAALGSRHGCRHRAGPARTRTSTAPMSRYCTEPTDMHVFGPAGAAAEAHETDKGASAVGRS